MHPHSDVHPHPAPAVRRHSAPWLVAGLGNPGPAYAGNRHNVGFRIADLLVMRMNGKLRRHRRAVAEVAEGFLTPSAAKVIVVKPLTYMNLSGGPVAGLAHFYKVPLEQIIAVHDELDIPYGQIRLKLDGGDGGHNGVRSLVRSLASNQFLRVRFGIGRPPGRQDPADYVLSDFAAHERKELDVLIDRAADAIEALVSHGLAWAQNAYHGTLL